jgi:serine/threonine protein kinase
MVSRNLASFQGEGRVYVCPKCHDQNSHLGAMCPRDGHYFIPEESVGPAQTDPYIGNLTAGKYVILGLINEGGMGAVYRALQLPVERQVAFKVLRAELQDSDQGQDRFVREARAVSRLSHPNIITLHDFGLDENGHPYMVMEYAPGLSLATWVLRENVTTERILHVTRQILSALSDAHEQGIVHRDLKPDNMIVTRSGTDHDFIKLLDFGIARMLNERSTKNLTREGEVFGTPHYMSPEQAQGRKDIGPPADIYAVGIMIWELICGHCPFDADTPLAVLFMHINEPLPSLEWQNGVFVDEALEALVIKATQKDPKDRYQTAHEMLIALESMMGFTPGAPGNTGERPRQNISRQSAPRIQTDGLLNAESTGATDDSFFPVRQNKNTKMLIVFASGIALIVMVVAGLFWGSGDVDEAAAETANSVAEAVDGTSKPKAPIAKNDKNPTAIEPKADPKVLLVKPDPTPLPAAAEKDDSVKGSPPAGIDAPASKPPVKAVKKPPVRKTSRKTTKGKPATQPKETEKDQKKQVQPVKFQRATPTKFERKPKKP